MFRIECFGINFIIILIEPSRIVMYFLCHSIFEFILGYKKNSFYAFEDKE